MIIENMYQAKTHLSKLVEKTLEGEDVVLAKAGKPLVKLVPYKESGKPIKLGLMKGKIRISEDFDSLSQEVAELFEGYLD